MTQTEFLFKAKKLIYNDTALIVNQLLGVSKTNQATIGLFGHVPINIELRKSFIKPTSGMKKRAVLAQNISCYLKHDDSSSVYFSIFYDTEKDLDKLFKSIEKHSYYIAYMYLRELFKLMRNHNTKAYYNMMRKHIMASNRSIAANDFYHIINKANEYAINTYIYALLSNSPLASLTDKLMEFENYNHNYKLTPEVDILNDLLTSYSPGTPIVDEGFSFYNDSTSIEHYSDYAIKEDDEQLVYIGETVKHSITEATKGRGTASAQIFAEMFTETPVKVGWFKKLRKSFKRIVKHQTENYSTSWSALNNVYRHKFKSPKHIYEKNSIELYLSVDHSGSMSEEELGKLLFLIKSQSKKISKLTVWIHDSEIVKEFIISADEDLQNSPTFKAALANRYSSGGTSFRDVFKRLVEIKPDPTKSVYMAFSDFVADVPECLEQYPEIRSIPTYWLHTINNPLPKSCGGTNITME